MTLSALISRFAPRFARSRGQLSPAGRAGEESPAYDPKRTDWERIVWKASWARIRELSRS